MDYPFPDEKMGLIEAVHKALSWIRNHTVKGRGVCVTHKKKIPYPEVTGYTIPTLIAWKEEALARRYAEWLLSIQMEDGSFPAVNGAPYTFDTGQVLRGLCRLFDFQPDVFEGPVRSTCDWLLTQINEEGRMLTPSDEYWRDLTDDRIHLYVLPPLKESGEKLGVPAYLDGVKKVLDHYKGRSRLLDFDTLSHFYGYIVEALSDLGETDLALTAMERIASLQKEDGSVPAYEDRDWICLPAVAQFALIGYKTGMVDFADRALRYLLTVQRRSGGFLGSRGRGATYMPKEEVSWACKFFLDACYQRLTR